MSADAAERAWRNLAAGFTTGPFAERFAAHEDALRTLFLQIFDNLLAQRRRNLESNPAFDEDYQGKRWRYGLQFRPVGFATVPRGYIIGSDRTHQRFTHGTIDYPFQLRDEEVQSYQLVEVSQDAFREAVDESIDIVLSRMATTGRL